MIRVLPQSGATASAKVTVGVPQLSVAVAEPVAVGEVLAPHSTVTLVGHVITGGVMSRTVMTCTQLEALPHGSAARQVREMTYVLPQPLLTESLKVIAKSPQLSVRWPHRSRWSS